MKNLLFGLAVLGSLSAFAETYQSFHSGNSAKTYELGLNYLKIERIIQLDGSIVSRIISPVFELRSDSEIEQRHVHAIYFARNVFCKSLNLGEAFTGSTLSDGYFAANSMLTVGASGHVSEREDSEPKKIYTSIDCIRN